MSFASDISPAACATAPRPPRPCCPRSGPKSSLRCRRGCLPARSRPTPGWTRTIAETAPKDPPARPRKRPEIGRSGPGATIPTRRLGSPAHGAPGAILSDFFDRHYSRPAHGPDVLSRARPIPRRLGGVRTEVIRCSPHTVVCGGERNGSAATPRGSGDPAFERRLATRPPPASEASRAASGRPGYDRCMERARPAPPARRASRAGAGWPLRARHGFTLDTFARPMHGHDRAAIRRYSRKLRRNSESGPCRDGFEPASTAPLLGYRHVLASNRSNLVPP